MVKSFEKKTKHIYHAGRSWFSHERQEITIVMTISQIISVIFTAFEVSHNS